MARLTGANCVDELLCGFLRGIRSTPKEDINCSIAKLVYDGALTVPGDFTPSTNAPPSPSVLFPWIRQAISKFTFTPILQHGVVPQQMTRKRFTSLYEFIRRNLHKPPLTLSYEEPSLRN